MINKFMRYAAKHGIKKAIARSFVEIGKTIDHSVIPSEVVTSPHLIFTSSVHIFSLFRETIHQMEHPKILELGSRAVTKDKLHHMLDITIPHEYTGLDIHEGPNVDVIGDAHELSSFLPKENFDVVMSKAVFEHLAMPWKVALEINTVLKENGIVFILSHHTFPLHEKPWDFWRFSAEAWKVLFNKSTGFEIIEAGMELPCKITAWHEGAANFPIDYEAYINSVVLARKISAYDQDILKWDIGTKDILESSYPKQ